MALGEIPTNHDATNPDVLIIGSGFGGLCMAIQLRKAGLTSFTILERAGDLGGTWRENHYPGCACDVQSHVYSYSFEPNPEWSRMFATQGEIWAYLRRCADKHGIQPHIRFRENVKRVRFDETRGLWIAQTERGHEYRAKIVVSGMGALSNPAYPKIPGMDRFEGESFHSATWNHDYDFGGKRVAVIGTGASAIQFVPQIAPKVARLDLYQRTPPWILPKPDRAIGSFEKAIYRALPFTQKLMRWAIYWQLESRLLGFTIQPKLMTQVEKHATRYIHRKIRSPELRRKVTPDYTIGCKRILLTSDYYPAIARDNVDVITDEVVEVRPRSVVTADGREREVDAIVYGTGFKVQEVVPRGTFFGRNGQDLTDAWKHGIEAYKGTTVSGFPNLFFLLGPNTGLGHNSMVYIIESQVAYVMDALRQMKARRWTTVEVKPDVQAKFNEVIQAKSEKAVWLSGCSSWYLDDKGRNITLWPDFTWRFRQKTRRFDAAAYYVDAVPTWARNNGRSTMPQTNPMSTGAR